MQFKTVALAFLAAAGASAQGLTAIPNSVLLVLATALPESDRSFALASSSEFAAQMASSLAAGNTPAWYQGLPDNIKSVLPQLYPPPTPAVTTSSAAVTPAISSSPSSGPTGRNSSVISTVSSATLRSTEGSPSSSGSAPPSQSTGGAAVPSGVIGAGLAGAIGVLGMLAL